MNIAPWVPCSNCNTPITAEEKFMFHYFNEDVINCKACNHKLDWWSVMLAAIENNFMLNGVFAAVGAKSKIINIYLKPNERTTYKLSDYGIPKNAKILHVNYTSQGGNLFPAEIHGNDATLRVRHDQTTVYPIPFNAEPGEETKVSIFVTYADNLDSDISWKNLVEAFELYSMDDYKSAIIPANVAIESTLTPMLLQLINKHVAKNRTEDFFSQAATYGHQLNVLLPLLASIYKWPKLNDVIKGQLNRLRSFRNDIAHRGVPSSDIKKRDMALMLCSALFAFYYIQHIDQKSEQPNE